MDSFDFILSSPIQQVPTQYFDNKNNSNLVINLFFLWSNSIELNNYKIHLELCFPSDHTPLTIDIVIDEEFIQVKRYTIIKSSEEETKFMFDLIKGFRNINTSNISDKDSLEHII